MQRHFRSFFMYPLDTNTKSNKSTLFEILFRPFRKMDKNKCPKIFGSDESCFYPSENGILGSQNAPYTHQNKSINRR
jgi:hypothetical protein